MLSIREMIIGSSLLGITTLIGAPVVMAEELRSPVVAAVADQQEAAQQPENGKGVEYPFTINEGAFAGCTVQASEEIFGRDGGNFGVFRFVKAEAECGDKGSFSYKIDGAWDSRGFLSDGVVTAAAGEFEHLVGYHVVQLNGFVKDGVITYDLVVFN